MSVPSQTPSATQMNGTPMYTVEQVELIRRLRNSGVTKDQLVQAWESLDRLDRELGPVYTVPVTIAAAFQQQAQALQRASLNAAFSALAAPPNVAVANAAAANAAAVANAVANAASAASILNLPPVAVGAPPQPPTQPQTPQPPSHQPQGPPSDSSPQSSSHHSPSSSSGQISRKRSVDGLITNGEVAESQQAGLLAGMPNGGGAPHPQPMTPLTPNDLVNLINGVTETGEDAEDTQEYRDFVSRGEPNCAEEIKAFVVQNNIKQQQIATLAGISQSYVSRYLKGDYYDMSERSRRAIQKWFILYRKFPGAIIPAVNAVTLMNPSPEKKVATVNEVSCMATPSAVNGDFLKYPRRERFVFRPNHLEILEKCFQDDNYPSFEKREEIAKACNAATEAMTGRELGDKERVTAQIISNWFANKRKELKKIAREEGLDVSQVPLRPRGRPSRLYSDLAMLQAMERGGGHAGSFMLQQPLTPHTPDTPHGTMEHAMGVDVEPATSSNQNMPVSTSASPPTTAATTNNTPVTTSNNVAAPQPQSQTTQQQQQQAQIQAAQAQISREGASSANQGVPQLQIAQQPQQTQGQPQTPPQAPHHPASAGNTGPVEADGTILAGPNDLDNDNDESLSWSVEIAAVNQAILSLTGQQPINTNPVIKHEPVNNNPKADIQLGGNQGQNNNQPPTAASREMEHVPTLS